MLDTNVSGQSAEMTEPEQSAQSTTPATSTPTPPTGGEGYGTNQYDFSAPPPPPPNTYWGPTPPLPPQRPRRRWAGALVALALLIALAVGGFAGAALALRGAGAAAGSSSTIVLGSQSAPSVNVSTNIASLQPGDLVFFVGVGDGGSMTNPGHVGIYIGNGEMVDAPYTGALVSIDPVTPSAAGGFVGGGPAW